MNLLSFRTNANVDLIVRGTSLLSALDVDPGDASEKENLESLEDLQHAFHHYFQQGAGAERPFTSEKVFKQVIKTASSLEDAQVGSTINLNIEMRWKSKKVVKFVKYCGILKY